MRPPRSKVQDNVLKTIPRGYKFRPEDVELIEYYLKPKIAGHIINPGRIHHVDVYMHSPQELNDTYKYEGEQHTYFFTLRNRKYPNGKRPARATGDFGFWKATGKEIPIISNNIVIENRRTLVFYQKKPMDGVKDGVKTNWIMQEFTIEKDKNLASSSTTPLTMQLDGWVLCKIYKTNCEKERKDTREVTISTNVVATPQCKSNQLFQGQNMQTHLSTNLESTEFEFNQDALHIQPHLSLNLVASPQYQPDQYYDAQYMQNLISSSSPTLGSRIYENSSEFNDSYMQMDFNDIHVAATNVVDTPEFQPNQYPEPQNMQKPFSPSSSSLDSIIPPHSPLPKQSSDEDYFDPYDLINFDDIDDFLDFE